MGREHWLHTDIYEQLSAIDPNIFMLAVTYLSMI